MRAHRAGRLAVSALVVAVGALTPASSAALPCGRVIDPARDDAVVGHDRGVVSFGSLDVVSADMATDAARVTVVVRVAKLASLELGSPTGIEYKLSAESAGRKYTFVAQRLPEGDRFRVFVTGTAPTDIGPNHGYVGDATGVFDVRASEVRMTAPLRLIGSPVARQSVFGRFKVTTYRQVGTANETFPATSSASADMAESNREYLAGTRTCVKVGA